MALLLSDVYKRQRYSYVLNNPMKWTDPGGHAMYLKHEDAEVAIDILTAIIDEVQNRRSGDNRMLSLSIGSAGAAVGMLIGGIAAALLGISIRVGTAIITPDSLGIDLNGNLGMLNTCLLYTSRCV